MSGGMQLKTEVINTSLCALCGACLNHCPYIKNMEDHLVFRFDCNVEKGRCYEVCPRTYTDWDTLEDKYLTDIPKSIEVGRYTKVFKVKSLNPVSGKQDGSTVTTLLKTAIEEKFADSALLTFSSDGITPQSCLSKNIIDIEKAAGSKFLASPSLKDITNAKSQGLDSIAIVGRPCQIQAVRKIQNTQSLEQQVDLFTIGLFCMWSLSWEFKEFINNNYPDLKIKQMRIPQNSFELVTEVGVENIPVEVVKEFISSGCKYCLDMTSELADISVGAFEKELGYNTLIVRSKKGEMLIKKVEELGYLDIHEYPEEEFLRLKLASLNKKIRAINILEEGAQIGVLKPHINLNSETIKQIIGQAEGKVNS